MWNISQRDLTKNETCSIYLKNNTVGHIAQFRYFFLQFSIWGKKKIFKKVIGKMPVFFNSGEFFIFLFFFSIYTDAKSCLKNKGSICGLNFKKINDDQNLGFFEIKQLPAVFVKETFQIEKNS